MTAAEQEYADALASAIATSLRRDPVAGHLSRLVIRWFEGPDYLTIHALGTGEERDLPSGDAWYPLEWSNQDREIDRVDAVMQDEALAAAVERLTAELGEDGWSWDEQPAPLIAAARRFRELVQAGGIAAAPHFAVGVSHFEGWGPAESVPRGKPRAGGRATRRAGLAPGGLGPVAIECVPTPHRGRESRAS